MKLTRKVVKTTVGGLAAGLLLAAGVHAETGQMTPMPGKSGTGTLGTASKMGAGGMMKGMMGAGGMMQMHEKMQADMKAMDDELDALVVKMNQASGSDKMDAMAAVITKMAQQRKMMDQKMAAMQASMMQGMMGGKGGGMKMTPPMVMPQGK